MLIPMPQLPKSFFSGGYRVGARRTMGFRPHPLWQAGHNNLDFQLWEENGGRMGKQGWGITISDSGPVVLEANWGCVTHLLQGSGPGKNQTAGPPERARCRPSVSIPVG